MEHLYIQQKYLSFASTSLEQFKQKGNLLWNCRCPYCGDSQKNISKARGYIYKNKDNLLSFQCHNCGENHKFKTFLKFLNLRLYKEYLLEVFKESSTQPTLAEDKEKSEIVSDKEWVKHLTPISSLSKIHPAVEYLKSRKIPKEKYSKFWYTSNFKDFVEKINLDQTVPADPRIILVETDIFGNLKLLIARSFKQSTLRYITIKVDKNYPKIFGLGSLDRSKPIYVVEGAIDSLFLDNCIATLDANLLSYEQYELDIKNAVHIWDNEPRNSDVCRNMKNAIMKNKKIVIWPADIVEKDINKMIESGVDVVTLIKQRTFYYLQATLEFSKWKKVSNDIRKTIKTTSSKKRAWVK